MAMEHAEAPKPSIGGLAVTLVGLAVLLVVPMLAWQRTESIRERIEEDVDPARHRIGIAIETANRARSVAFYYLFTRDREYALRYADLVTEWRRWSADDARIARCGPEVEHAWRAGTGELNLWFARYGSEYIRTGRHRNLPEADRQFLRGEALLASARTQADKLSLLLRSRAGSVSHAEVAVSAAMAMISLLVAAFAWEDARSRRVLWMRERDAAERLRLAVREINHRVKNNLQVIAALLDMHLMEEAEAVHRSRLEELLRQVRAMAAVHEFLSRGPAGDQVPAGAVLERLVELAGKPCGLAASVQSENILLTIKQANALALIVNELLLNASKHGATAVRVRLQDGAGHVRLTVGDNGPGFEPGFEMAKDAAVGLSLVRTLAEHDLRGELHLYNDGGAVVEVSFPLVRREGMGA
ncbi:MAG: sensor histidine kinase [Chthonomonadales bacterium]